jgi:ApaG protein
MLGPLKDDWADQMYRAVTRSIQVTVTPHYSADQSSPAEGRYFWAYHIIIENLGSETVQLQSRYWHITDGLGRVQEVRGAGVVGETPILAPGEQFAYTSGCPLETPEGIMVGEYGMVTDQGEYFTVSIPAFSLDSPASTRILH